MSADGIVQIERGDPRYCPLTVEHEPHRYEYEYDRPEHLGGHTHGNYWCDGIPTFPEDASNVDSTHYIARVVSPLP